MTCDLIYIPEDECLIDVDESAWRKILDARGGCTCFISPPCWACAEPLTEAELTDAGDTYDTT